MVLFEHHPLAKGCVQRMAAKVALLAMSPKTNSCSQATNTQAGFSFERIQVLDKIRSCRLKFFFFTRYNSADIHASQ